MANTVIQLKKSGTPSATPVSLANGELAINYADGKLFYKDTLGIIQEISGSGGGGGGDKFTTVNAAGILLVADLPTDILNIVAGQNIDITGDALTDSLTIAANLSTIYTIANAAFDRANLSNDVLFVTSSFDTANAAFDKANSANVLAYDTGIGANAYALQKSVAVGAAGNVFTSLAYDAANAAFGQANAGLTYSNNIYFFANNMANTTNAGYVVANSAFDKANAANVLAYNTGIGANAYTDISTASANNYAGVMANSGNSYTDSSTSSANNYAGAMANAANAYATSLTPDLSPAFNKANDSYTIANAAFDKANSANVLAYNTGIGANVYSTTVGEASNNYTNVSVTSANNYAGAMANSANSYAGDMANASNSYSGVMANSANSYSGAMANSANAYTVTVGAAANNWANTKLSNTSGVVFGGNLTISNDLTIGNNLYSINSAFFDTTTVVAGVTKGQIVWNQDDETFDIGLANDSVLQVGQETLYRVKNQTGSTITQGTVVMAAGTLGASGRILVTPAISNGTYPSKYLMGVTTSTIETGGEGYVTHFGKVRGLDTSMWSEGDILYANVTVAGALQNTMPTAPNTKTTVAIVVSKHATNGELFVRPTYGSKLNEDELVELNSLTDSDVLVYVSANGRFENRDTLVSAFNAANQSGTVANNANTYANSTYVKKAGDTISGDLTVQGNVTISGKTTYANTQTLLIGDNIITLNNDLPADVAPSEDAGIEIKRGTLSNVSVLWNESSDKWTFTNDGTAYKQIASNTDIESANNYAGAMANSVNAYTSATYSTLTQLSSNWSAQNTTFDVANAAFGKANSANNLAKAAYDFANTLGGGGATVSATAPSTPSEGDLWWNTTYGRLLVYYNDGDTSQWVDATATASGARVVTTNTTPTGAVAGQLWWNSEYGRLFVYYNDGDTSQWVDTNPATDIGSINNIANAAFDKANAAATYSYVNTSSTSANTWANTVGSSSNNYSGVMANSSNAYAGVMANSSNNYAGVMANSSNAYAGVMANSSNAYAGVMANSSNAYAGVMANSANAWSNTKLANTDVVLAGNLTSTQGVSDRNGDLRNIPVNNQTSSYVLTLADNGKVISLTTGNVFVTANVFYAGNTVSVFNNSAANLTITQNTSVTIYSAGTANTGNRILQQRGVATLVCVAANTFVVTGAGLVS